MDIAAAGTSMMFFLLTALQVLIGLMTLTYAAHSFLVVLIQTAAGSDQIVWPDEPFQDWLWKPWYLAWLVLIWAVPVTLVLDSLTLPIWMIRLLGIGFVWFILPLTLLSSLSASSRLVIFQPAILKQLGGHFSATLAFYAVTWLLVLGCAALVNAVFVRSQFLVLLTVPVAVAAGVLLYARLLGRLAWVLNRRNLGKRRKATAEEDEKTEEDARDPWALPEEEAGPALAPPKARQATPPRAKRSKKAKREQLGAIADPWMAPPLEAPPEIDWRAGLPADVVAQGIYGVSEAEPPPPPPLPPLALADEEPIPVRPTRPDPEGKNDPRSAELSQVSEYELQLAQRRREPAPPAWPMITGVYSFLGYPSTLAPLLAIALGLFLMGLVLKGQQSFFPF